MNKEEYRKILECLQGKVDDKKLWKQADTFEVRNGKLYKKKKNGKILRVLQEDETETVMYMVHNHEMGGHFGIDATYNKIAERYYWKGMYEDTKEYVKFCDNCQRRGQKGGKSYLNPIEVGEPFERIGIDFVGPLEKTRRGNRYILVTTDYLTKWPEAKAMKDATATNVVKFIYEVIICRHGCPKIILSDRGTHFRNKLVEELCEKFEIKHKLSAPYHSQTNGLVERFNRTLCESLAKVSEKENQWDEHIEQVLIAYRTTKHATTKRTPFFMTYGREATLPIDEIEIQENISEKESILKRTYDIINLTEEREEARSNVGKSQEKQKKRYDNRIGEETILKIEDKVLLKDAAKEKQWSGKLASKWKGPYYIHKEIGKGAYKLRTLDGKVLKTSHNVKHVKKYYDTANNH